MICPVCRWPLDPNGPVLGLVPLPNGVPDPTATAGGALWHAERTFYVHPACIILEPIPGRAQLTSDLDTRVRRMESNLDAYAEILPARAPRR